MTIAELFRFPDEIVDDLASGTGLPPDDVNEALIAGVVGGYMEFRETSDGGTCMRLTMPKDRGPAFDRERQRAVIEQLRQSRLWESGADDDQRMVVAVGLLVSDTFPTFTEDDMMMAASGDINVTLAARYVLAEAEKGVGQQ